MTHRFQVLVRDPGGDDEPLGIGGAELELFIDGGNAPGVVEVEAETLDLRLHQVVGRVVGVDIDHNDGVVD